MQDLTIRNFQIKDKPAVREICCDTADKGKPVEGFFPDREIIADLVTRYYVEFEPESLWIADFNGQAVGYLSGCLNNARCQKISLSRIMPGVFLKSLLRRTFLKKQAWMLLSSGLKSLFLGGFNRKIPQGKYPGHLHVNIKEGFRNKGMGRKLVDAFLAQAVKNKLKGIQVSVREDNQDSVNFFEKLGFRIIGRYPMIMPEGSKFVKSHTLILAIDF